MSLYENYRWICQGTNCASTVQTETTHTVRTKQNVSINLREYDHKEMRPQQTA
jgi:hypothetical protein